MKLASYRTERGARRYAAEIERVWAATVARAWPEVNGFRWAVRVKMRDGRTALAARRPRNFGRT